MYTVATTTLEYALAYAAYGWRVFPCHTPTPYGCSCGKRGCGNVGKHPRTPHGVHDATTDERLIRTWWSWWPDANVAIATGSGLVVLDIDPRNGGNESLQKYVAAFGQLHTLTCRTGGGGLHFYASSARRLRCKPSLLPGLDLKGEGGYVLAPPSMHASGRRYEWINK